MDNPPKKPAAQSQLEVEGWRFAAVHDAAISSDERARLAHTLGLEARVPLPEMVFSGSSLTLEHAARNVRIHFAVEPALRMWANAHAANAEKWDHTHFDYTYCTNYHGTVETCRHELQQQQQKQVVVVRTEERLPTDKLLQHVQILYYDHVLLFEDDVRDLGEILLEAKIRVMSFGFLVLCRYYCRIDGKVIKLIDTRYYHEFGQPFVWRDIESREATYPELYKQVHGRGAACSMSGDEHMRQLDVSADAIYTTVAPFEVVTEKIFFERTDHQGDHAR